MSLPDLFCRFGLKDLFDKASTEAVEWFDGLGTKHLITATAYEVYSWIDSRFRDSSRAVLRAIFDANRRSWEVIGLALTERTFGERVRDVVREGALKAARDDIRRLIGAIPADQRASAADELAALHARHRHAAPDTLNAAEVTLRRFSDPAGVAAEADLAAAALPNAIATDAPNLAFVLGYITDGKTPLFQTFYRYHFRKRVAKNPELSRLLLRDELRALAEVTDARTAGILDQFDALFDAIDAQFANTNAKIDAGFATTNAKVDDVAEEVRKINERLAEPRKPGVELRHRRRARVPAPRP